MKHLLLYALLMTMIFQNVHSQEQLKIPDYKSEALKPGTNYHQLVAQVRARLKAKLEYLAERGITVKNSNSLREEVAHFERWAHNLWFQVGPNGTIPNTAAGWVNINKSNPELLDNNSQGPITQRTSAQTWTSIGPFDSAILNTWAHGAGIGRINVVRRHPVNKNVLFAGAAVGGVFKSENMGQTWTAKTDMLAGLGVSDIVINPTNPLIMYMATGDFDASHINSIGVYKSVNGGDTWTATTLTFDLKDEVLIAHLYIDPENSNRIYATTTFRVFRSDDAGANWDPVIQPGPTGIGEQFNDIVKVVSGTIKRVFVTSKTGKLYRSQNDGNSFDSVYHYKGVRDDNGNLVGGRLDFDFSPNKPDVLFLLGQVNPAFSKYTISTNTVAPYKTITNSAVGTTDTFKTQGGYNQVIAVSPTNGDSIWVADVPGRLSTDGGNTWQNKFNGYYETDPNSAQNWGGYYIHSDYHHLSFIGSDSMLIGNDGGVYIGKISTDSYQQRFNGLVTTQSYTMALYDSEPDNLIAGNQDNDGSSRVGTGTNAKYYGAQAGDGTATAIARNNPNLRYLGGTNGQLGYSTNGYTSSYKSTTINTPSGAPFVWDLQMHSTNETILYGGFKDVYKMTGAPKTAVTDWVALNSGAVGKVQTIALADNNTTTQKIIIIDSANNVRKSATETGWSTITKPTGMNFTSIYAKKSDWNVLLATTAGYDSATKKVFYSNNNGVSWTNITRNMPNILMKKVILYEGTDTVFVATELGVFFSTISTLTGPVTGLEWTKYGGTTLPNVRVDDMEISYTKKQLYAATFGRGLWMTDINSNTVLPLHALQFSYAKTNSGNQLKWKIEDVDVVKTTLERSYDGVRFTDVDQFTSIGKTNQSGYPVANESSAVYYRINYAKATGQKIYSHIIVIRPSGSSTMVNIYPNPTKGNIFISSEKRIDQVRIFSLVGQQVTFARPNNNFYSFDMSLLPAGTYLLEVLDNEGNRFQQKIVRN